MAAIWALISRPKPTVLTLYVTTGSAFKSQGPTRVRPPTLIDPVANGNSCIDVGQPRPEFCIPLVLLENIRGAARNFRTFLTSAYRHTHCLRSKCRVKLPADLQNDQECSSGHEPLEVTLEPPTSVERLLLFPKSRGLPSFIWPQVKFAGKGIDDPIYAAKDTKLSIARARFALPVG